MLPCTCALMLALMKPSNVATRSSTRGTSCGVTVVTRTSGGGGAVCAGLREQPPNNEHQISTALTRTIRLILFLSLLAFRCRAEHDDAPSVFRGIVDLTCFGRRGRKCEEQTELALRTAGHCFQASLKDHGQAD